MDTGRLAFGHATAAQYLIPPGVSSDSQAKLNDERVLQEILKHHDPSNLVMITHGGDGSAADVVAKAQAVLSESELLRAMFDVGYFPPNTPPDE